MNDHDHSTLEFPRDLAGLPQAAETATVDVADGDRFELRIAPVAKQLGDETVRMLAYNGSVPGPTLRVREGSELLVDVVNEGDLDATVHWHGLRLDNRYDGTHETQAPIPIGGRFTYRIEFPDAGVYWYHPHIREDYGQELGLYGNIVVVPAEPDYWPPAHREVALTLDDVLVEDGKIASFSRDVTTHAAMGRFGNLLLVAGETDPALHAQPGEVVRLYLTNTANTRVFNVMLPGARMKLVGGDSGRYEREELVDSVVLAPSERAVVDVLFSEPGRLELRHSTPERTYRLARVEVAGGPAAPPLAEAFHALRTNPEWEAERRQLPAYLHAPPDKTLGFAAELDLGTPEGAVVYVCPMHPEVVADEQGSCPKCGMKLLPAELVERAAAAHDPRDHEEHGHHSGGGDDRHDHAHHGGGGIEWEDDMVEVNRLTTSANTRWKLVDRDTCAEGHAIDWRFRVGDRVKLRLVNELDSDHPMHHPFHVHGAGRLLVLARDGVAEPNLVWKDTVLVERGQVVDVLLDVTNPGVWMAHCHIAEHHESGMMFSFVVDP